MTNAIREISKNPARTLRKRYHQVMQVRSSPLLSSPFSSLMLPLSAAAYLGEFVIISEPFMALVESLVIIQKRSSLLISRHDGLVSSEADLFSKNSWNSNHQSGKEEYCHDGEGENPLEGDSSSEELANSQSSRQNAECEAHGIILQR